MASTNPHFSSDSEEDPDYQIEADEDDTEYDETDDDDDASGVSISVVEIPDSGDLSDGGADQEHREESSSSSSSEEEVRNGAKTCSEAPGASGSGSGVASGKVEVDGALTLNCPVCYEPWTPEGPHRVCCIPCGHVYGRSCLEKWIQQCRKKAVKCPMCSRGFKQKEIVNLYAPLIAVQNDELKKEVHTLREKNEQLQSEKANLIAEINQYRKHQMDRESSDRSKKACIEHPSPRATQRSMFGYCDERLSSSSQTFLENIFPPQNYTGDEYHNRSLVLQKELLVDGARVMGIDASGQILLVSGKSPEVVGEHVIHKISLFAPHGTHEITLPPNTGAIRDICILPNGLALFASLGKKLSLFSTGSNNLVLKYDLPGPAWSCSMDCNSQYHIYAGLQNGTLLVFDIRQTATHMVSMDGLSRHPIHTVHSLVSNDNSTKVLTASSLGPCVWDIGGSREGPFLVPALENHGVCIALAHSSWSDDIVASFRPKVELPNEILPSQSPSVSPSGPVFGSARVGTHVLIKRVNGVIFQKQEVTFGGVSEARMSKSAVVCLEGDSPLFAYGDEATCGLCLWGLPSFQLYKRLKPHRHPILDLKYARGSAGPGLLGCISEDKLQVFTCF